MKKHLLAGAILLAALAAGCGSNDTPPDGVPVSPPVLEEEPGEHVDAIQTEPVSVAQQMAGQKDVVQVVMTDKGFEPNVLTTTVGGRVKIHLRNAGTKEHNLVLGRYGIFTSNMAPGSDNYIEFTASEKGEWAFFSDAPGEQEPGLSGILKVE